MLLIVMYEAGTWRAQPGQTVTFGRGQECTIQLPAGDRGLSRSAGSLSFHDGAWWLGNESSSSMLYLSGDRGVPRGPATRHADTGAAVACQGAAAGRV